MHGMLETESVSAHERKLSLYMYIVGSVVYSRIRMTSEYPREAKITCRNGIYPSRSNNGKRTSL